MLEFLTTHTSVGIIANVKAVELVRRRIVFSESAFAELVLWQVPKPVAGSAHEFKYRLTYVVDGICMVRYDNEAGKGDHRHFNGKESAYAFKTPEELIDNFQRDIERWNREDRDS
jgi:Family of unknown function (DUF6516)